MLMDILVIVALGLNAFTAGSILSREIAERRKEKTRAERWAQIHRDWVAGPTNAPPIKRWQDQRIDLYR